MAPNSKPNGGNDPKLQRWRDELESRTFRPDKRPDASSTKKKADVGKESRPEGHEHRRSVSIVQTYVTADLRFRNDAPREFKNQAGDYHKKKSAIHYDRDSNDTVVEDEDEGEDEEEEEDEFLEATG